MTVLGRHLVVDAFGCPADTLNDADLVERLLADAVKAVGAQVLHTYFHRFQPQGVTGTIVISTSHLTIHTWPEQQYAAFDLFTCGGADPWEAMERVLHSLGAERFSVCDMARGNTEGMKAKVREVTLRERPPRGDAADLFELKELLAGPHAIQYEGYSPHQEVLVVEAQDVRMYLDKQLQFSSIDERLYHEALVHPVMTMAGARNRVLIVGGGDGLALREVLKYRDVKRVDLVDLDAVVLRIAQEVPALANLNERSLHDRRVRVFPEDAAKFIRRRRRPYDVILIDFPDPSDEAISRLYTTEFLGRLSKRLAPNGVLVSQAHSPEDAPLVYWSIGLTLVSAGLCTLSYHREVPSFGDWGFHLAALTPLQWPQTKVPVPQRTLPDDLTEWFCFDEDVAAVREQAVINSLDNLVLHQLYQEEVGSIDPERSAE